jgi:CheY-specific phosphatase CheX
MLELVSTDKISKNFDELYTYTFFLPESNKAELINEVKEIINDIKNNSLKIEQIDSLYTYTFFLPENNKAELINEVDNLKNVIQKYIETKNDSPKGVSDSEYRIYSPKGAPSFGNTDDSEYRINSHGSEPLFSVFSENSITRKIPVSEPTDEQKNPETCFLPEEINEETPSLIEKVNEGTTSLIEDLKAESTVNIEFSDEMQAPDIVEKIKPVEDKEGKSLYEITSVLVPTVTEKGTDEAVTKKIPKNYRKLLNRINNKSSIAELYSLWSHSYDNYLEFLIIIYKLENDGLIKLIKTENIDEKSTWIKIGQILVESNVVHQVNIINALNYQKMNMDMMLGDALLELRFITVKILDNALILQEWFKKVFKESIFIEGIIKTGSPITKIINSNSVFEFIIPEFTPEGRHKVFTSTNGNLINMVNILNGNSSLQEVYEKNKSSFKNDKLLFIKLIQKLDSLGFLTYQKNEKVKEVSHEVRFEELVLNLGLVNEEQIEETLVYRQKNSKKLIGEILTDLNYLSSENLESCLNIQTYFNNLLTKVSYENAFIQAVNEVIQQFFKLPVDIGKFTKKEFNRPLLNMICIIYTFSGELNGSIYYLLDRNIADKLAHMLLNFYEMDIVEQEKVEVNKDIILELCNNITGNSLAKLSKSGIFCKTDMPSILMDDEIVINVNAPMSILPLTNEYGRFIIGFNLDKN